MMHKAWCGIKDVPYYFPRSSIKFQGHTYKAKYHQFRPELRVSGLYLQFEFIDGFEIMQKAWHSIAVIHQISRSHGLKNWRFESNVRLLGRSLLSNPQICLVNWNIEIPPKFAPNTSVQNTSNLVQIMAWQRTAIIRTKGGIPGYISRVSCQKGTISAMLKRGG